MPENSYSEFLKYIDISTKALLIYSETHPHTQQVIQHLLDQFQTLLKESDQVTVAVSDGKLLVNGQLVETTTPVLQRLYRDLYSRNIYSLSFNRGVTPEELLALFRSLNLKPQRIKQMGGFEQVVEDEGIRNIQANKLKYGIISEHDAAAQDLLGHLMLALQAAMAGEADVEVAAQNLEHSASESSQDASAVVYQVLNALARTAPSGDDARLVAENRDRLIQVVRSFSPEMLGKLLLKSVKAETGAENILSGVYRDLSPEKLEAAVMALLDQSADSPDVRQLVEALQKDDRIKLSDEIKQRLQLLGLLHLREAGGLDRWVSLLQAARLTQDQLQQVPAALTELLESERTEDADRLSKKVFALLSSKEPVERIAAVHLLPQMVSILSTSPAWKNLAATALLLVSTCYRKESEPDVLRVLLDYLLAAFRDHYVEKNFRVCNDLLATIRQRVEKEENLRESLLVHMGEISSLDEDLRRGEEGVDLLVEYLRLCGPEGAQYLLRLLAEEEDRHTRSSLINHMLRLNLESLLQALEAGMLDPRWYVVRNVITVAGKLPLAELPAFVVAAASNSDPRIVQELIKNLHRSTLHVRMETVAALLQHPEKSVRLQAVHLAGARHIREAAPAITEIAIAGGSSDGDLRAAALQILLKLRAQEAIPAAVAILERRIGGKTDAVERNAAVRLLGELNRAASQELLARVSRNDPNADTRALAASYVSL